MLKWFLYAVAVIFGLALFLPASGSTEIRNLPLLLALLFCLAVYLICCLIVLGIFVHRIKSILRQKGMQVKRTRIFPGWGYVVAETPTETVDVCFLLRKKKYYRYHFCSTNRVEYWKTTFSVARSSKRGTVARGAADTRMVGRQEISWRQFVEERRVHRYVVMNRLPDSISDAARREEVSDGDCICGSDIVLISLQKFENETWNGA